ncbi:unnamed protein product [Litomosoides sigmodontis]|uniref:CX domain-containing protein n=1 Tax=Litomosoides sigmodontis TaxID=42156 RepID=A0A3P6SJP0_LITSI|nr:unnamed protein product [Litomosoides sigmodontis]
MLRMLCYALMSTYVLFTTVALPIIVANKKDSKFYCKCTVDGDESTGCDGIATAVISGDGGMRKSDGRGVISTYVDHSNAGLLMPSVQIGVPQIQFPAPINAIPQYPYMFYHFQPFINVQQPSVTTQCCMPCPDGNGICCCTPGATTAAPHDSRNFPSGAEAPLRSASLFVSIAVLLLVDHIL